MNHLLMSLVFATALTGAALPARADTSPNHAHGGQGAMFTEVSRRVLAAGDYRASVKLLDGRAHFGHLHAGHPGHAGIPTHRLMVDFQAKFRARRVLTAADLEVVAPSGKVTQTGPLDRGRQTAGRPGARRHRLVRLPARRQGAGRQAHSPLV